MTEDLARLRAAQAKADEIVAPHSAAAAFIDGPRLLIAVIDPETNTRLATGFAAYSVEDEPAIRHLRSVS